MRWIDKYNKIKKEEKSKISLKELGELFIVFARKEKLLPKVMSNFYLLHKESYFVKDGFLLTIFRNKGFSCTYLNESNLRVIFGEFLVNDIKSFHGLNYCDEIHSFEIKKIIEKFIMFLKENGWIRYIPII